MKGQAVDLQTDAVGVIIIIAVAGGALQHLADVFLAFEVAFQSVQQLLHGQFLVVEDQLADSRQGVDGRTVAQAFEVAEIQAAFVVVILVQVHAFLHGQHMQGIGDGRGKVLRAGLDDVVLLHEGVAHQVVLLGGVGLPELFPGGEVAHVTGLHGQQFVAVLLHAAVVEHQFHGGTKVHLGMAAGVGIHAGHTDLGAAGSGIVIDVFQGSALGQMQGDDLVVIEQLGEAAALLDHLGHSGQEALGRTAVHTGGQVGIMQGHSRLERMMM